MWNTLFDVLYPRSCIGCGAGLRRDSGYLCWDCRAGLCLIRAPICSICGNPVEGRVDEEFVCWRCTENPPYFDRARSAVRYRGLVQTMLQEYKYRYGLWLLQDLTELIWACLETYFEPADIDAVVPVPLHPTRERTRGFNQAEMVARRLARRLARRMIVGPLVRVRSTSTQTRLTARERKLNVRGAFMIRREELFQDQRILLVDDVMTTGATVDECARVLKQAGALRVWVLTVARG